MQLPKVAVQRAGIQAEDVQVLVAPFSSPSPGSPGVRCRRQPSQPLQRSPSPAEASPLLAHSASQLLPESRSARASLDHRLSACCPALPPLLQQQHAAPAPDSADGQQQVDLKATVHPAAAGAQQPHHHGQERQGGAESAAGGWRRGGLGLLPKLLPAGVSLGKLVLAFLLGAYLAYVATSTFGSGGGRGGRWSSRRLHALPGGRQVSWLQAAGCC